MSERVYDAVVIGAGHNGLIAAAYLGRAGLKTLVVERSAGAGGALGAGRLGDAKVPAVAHTVGRLSAAVVADLDLRTHGFEPIEPDVRAWAPHPNGSSIAFYRDPKRTAAEIEKVSSKDAGEYVRFDSTLRSLAAFVGRMNSTLPPSIEKLGLEDAFGAARLGQAFRGLDKKDAQTLMRVMPMAAADFVGEFFENDFVRGALAYRGVQYTAMGPWSAGTAAVLLGDSAGNDGGAAGQTMFARGGTGTLVDALLSAARSAGVEVRFDSEVAQIRTDADARVTGVALASGDEIDARAVVSGTDPKRTLCHLLDPVVAGPQMRWRASNVRMPGTVGKVNLLLEALPRWSALDGDAEKLHGRIVIAPGIDYLERAHDDAKYGRVADSPFMEITIPTLADSNLAPDGVHAMSIVVGGAPYHRRDGDWDADRDNFGDLVMKSLDDYAPGIGDRVTTREVLTPLDLERRFGLTEGHPLHGEPSLDQMFAWRPLWGHARYRLGIDGLYLCGSGAHPGGGVTGGPGLNAAKVIVKDLKRTRD